MGWGTGNLGGGSGGLNFKIVSYATESELLADTPKENTIGVITSIPITGYHFGTEEPSPAAAGMVWIASGTSGNATLNALKKNGIQVNLISAKQYVDGAWSPKAASIFQNGEWIQFSYVRVYLFKSGEGALAELKTYRESKSTVTVGVDSIEINYSDTGEYYVVSVRTANKMHISGYTSLSIEYTSSKRISSTYAAFGVTSTEITKADVGITWAAKTAITASSSRKTLTVDLTNVSSDLYVALNFGGQMSIYNMWLE